MHPPDVSIGVLGLGNALQASVYMVEAEYLVGLAVEQVRPMLS